MKKNDSLIGRCVQLEMVDGVIINVQFLSVENNKINANMSVSCQSGGVQKVTLPLDDPFKDIANGIKHINEITKEVYDFSNNHGVIPSSSFLMEGNLLHQEFLNEFPPKYEMKNSNNLQDKTYTPSMQRMRENISSETEERIDLKAVLAKLHEENKHLKADNERLKEENSNLLKDNENLFKMKNKIEEIIKDYLSTMAEK